MGETTLIIEGMGCQQCAKLLVDSIQEQGIRVVFIDLKRGVIEVSEIRNKSEEMLKEIVKEAGYTLVEIRRKG